MKRRPILLASACLLLVALAGFAVLKLRGPLLPGYEISAQPLVQTVVATGRVAALSRALVGSEVTGVVLKRYVREGDRVQAGDLLAVLRADDLEAAVNQAEAELTRLQQSSLPQAQASVREAEVALAQASREVRRRRSLYQQRAIPREELERAEQAEAAARAAAEQARLEAQSLVAGNAGELLARARLASAQAQLAKTNIRAQAAGTVLTRNAEPGDLVQPSRVLFEIVHDGATEVLVPLDEKNLEVLALGQPALCIADAYPNRPFAARVDFIAPGVDPSRGTVDVRLAVPESPQFLREDMTVSVNIETGRRDSAIVVPNDALHSVNADQAMVWLVVDGRATRHPVQLGLRGLAATEVVSGLQDGDRVLAQARPDVHEGDPVRVQVLAFETVTAAPPLRAEDPAKPDGSTRNELPVPFN
ncbi:MAG TPA: efflux RND transporter periplasmic adaptor subunit [Pusillimonas sp.]|uniref:efflux RND transporter periplasmic adaptor subunit n=1 Tax=Pusillimonas sp. TaxID=3040095 RepID=UPI002BBC5560|nr:efflux RND transporter periplasmic adaptor subunit [Pusillimonas sp.]HUH86607.1 efflux RND transporter periplasmic adaptor subunit [Pusillimonas sp.]